MFDEELEDEIFEESEDEFEYYDEYCEELDFLESDLSDVKNDLVKDLQLDGKDVTKEEYIDIVIKQLELLREEIVIHRITSDPDKDSLIEPTWLLKKFCLLNDIDKEMKKRDTYQGKYTK